MALSFSSKLQQKPSEGENAHREAHILLLLPAVELILSCAFSTYADCSSVFRVRYSEHHSAFFFVNADCSYQTALI